MTRPIMTYRVYSKDGRHLASMADPVDAAVLVSHHGKGAEVRFQNRDTLWTEGFEKREDQRRVHGKLRTVKTPIAAGDDLEATATMIRERCNGLWWRRKDV